MALWSYKSGNIQPGRYKKLLHASDQIQNLQVRNIAKIDPAEGVWSFDCSKKG